MPDAELSFQSAVVVHPGAKFRAISQEQKWECDFSAERSTLSATAVFTALNVMLRDVEPTSPFIEKFNALKVAANSCFAVVGLENANASQT
jgi:hypothetical protein